MTEQEERLAEFIRREVMKNPSAELALDTPLVSSGLIDSLALVDILAELEKITETRIPAGKITAEDMDTVRLMFTTVARVGRPFLRR